MKWTCFFILCVIVDVQSINRSNVVFHDNHSYPCTDANHMFLSPGVLTSGGHNRACVSRFFIEGSAHLTLTLVTDNGHTVSIVRELAPGDGGCIDIAVPQIPNTKVNLTVNIRYPDAGCTWQARARVRVSSGQVLLLQTDRPRYRPGDTLAFRVLALNVHLTPGHAPIAEIWLEGPAGGGGAGSVSRVTSWRRTRTRLGLAQFSYRLDSHATHGRWTVRARLDDGTQGSSDFWVGDYDVPPFLLSVRHAATVLRSSERLVWNVCVRYPWSEAVEGMLVIRLRGAGGGGAGAGSGGAGVRTAVRLKAPKACHRHAVATRRIGLDGSRQPEVIIADFSFQEDGTRIWQNTTVVSQVVENPVTLHFLTKHRTVVAPGLPYKLKIKATRWDGKPSSNERVRICRSPASHPSGRAQRITDQDSSCDDSVTDARGIARVIFTTSDGETFAFYRFEASLHNNTEILAEPLYLPVQRFGASHAAFGPLSGESLSPGSRVYIPLYLNLKNIRKAITVHFVVVTRGGVIHRWGATNQCPIANSGRARSASRDIDCYYFDTNHSPSPPQTPLNNTIRSSTDSDTLLDRHLLRVMIPIKLTHQMCPDSHLIAYFYYNNELVTASKHIDVDECLANKAQLSWLTRQTKPGSHPPLQLTTQGAALCALSAIDLSSKWMQPEVPSLKETLINDLKTLIGRNRNMTSFDTSGDCYMNEDNPEIPSNAKELAVVSMAAAGVRWVGNDVIQKRILCQSPQSLTSAQDIPKSRSDFSESWLWRLVGIGGNGSAIISTTAPDSITRYEATALCVSRNGIAVSSPAILQVFQEFFIHADGPKKLRRGDSTIVKYRIFNYLYQPLAVQIQVLSDPHLEILSLVTENACINPRSSIAHRAEISARVTGNARVIIRGVAEWDPRCGNGSNTDNSSHVSDEVIIRVEIEHEGVPKQEPRSTLLCGADSSESSSSKVTWMWPGVSMVPGSDSMSIWAVGDITGPLLTDADALVSLPRGCGEQNMARLATNLLALNYLDLQSSAATIAKDHLAKGFSRQLQYMYPEGGFSAFGSSDGLPSTWLTAFAIRYLRRSYQVLSQGLPVPQAIERSERWLLNQQMENGCFRNKGQVFHKELKGGLGEEGEIASVALTAYVITSFVEGGANLPYHVIKNSLSCLRALLPMKTKVPTRTYAHALLAYTFMKLKKYEDDLRKTNDASLLWEKKEMAAGLHQDEEMRTLVELLRIAKRNGEFVWWETGSLSTSIEATGYAVLALSACPDSLRATSCAGDARGAVRWLSTQRIAAGGFLSTQDTLVALEALTSWNSVQPSAPPNLNVTVLCGSSIQTQALLPETATTPVLMKMKTCDVLKVGVEGTGCALIQATRSYHTTSSSFQEQNNTLSVQVSVHTDGPFDCDHNSTFCFCAAIVETCVVWTSAFPEMALLEVALPGGFYVDASLMYAHLQQSNTLLRRIEMSPNGGRVTMYLGTRDGSDVTTGYGGHQCYNLHAIGPRARTKAAYVKVMDYYSPQINDTQIYTIPEECPPRMSYEKIPSTGSDNLFNSARSLFDGEPIISDEYSFEDFSEGAPLEDPLYDNLANAEANESKPQPEVVKEESNAYSEPAASAIDMMSENRKDIIEEENEVVYRRDTDDTVLISDPHNNNETSKPLKSDLKANLQSQIATPDKIAVENPNLSHFHVIDSEKDLEVPAGLNGPLPSVVLPPLNFGLPPAASVRSDPPSVQAQHSINLKSLRRSRPNPYLQLHKYPIYRRSPSG